MTNYQWILNNGKQAIPCETFPLAFRTMFNIVRTAREAGKNVPSVTREISIVGPIGSPTMKKTYSYYDALDAAKTRNLLTADGLINSREFKKK